MLSCGRCKQPISTGLREWGDLGAGERFKYIATSILGVLLGGLLLSLLLYIILAHPTRQADWQDLRVLFLFLGITSAMVLIKLLDIGASRRRSRPAELPLKASLLTWRLNLSLYYSVLFLVLLILPLISGR